MRAPLQIVVMDDCSTDNTALILERYRKKHPRVLNVVSQRNSYGVSAAKNLAIRRSIGSHIALHDADDEFYPEKITRCSAAFADHPQ